MNLPTQINPPNSCFYEGDLTQVEPALDDAYVEYIERSTGEGAVPYVAATWFNSPINSGPLPGPMIDFSETWFYNWYQGVRTDIPPPPIPHNYFHLFGAGVSSGSAGRTLPSGYEAAFVFLGSIEKIRDPLNNNSPLTAQQITSFCQHTTVHELVGHQFNTNACAPSLGWHDQRPAWCAQLPAPPPPNPHACPPGSASPKNCVMLRGSDNTIAQQTDGVSRFCMEDLYLGDPNAPCISTIDEYLFAPDDTTIRTNTDPQ